MPAYSKNAILVAGMHRSGTSALTRVFSLLGADLPKRLAPALPKNNETGFWESVDLMLEHDALLASAGSFWSDWTEFNPAWYASAEALKYKEIIGKIVQEDFADSSLFVIKDPRICRFLPFWLDLLKDLEVKPFIIIPVRNPLEVALSLKKRDGFPLAKGGLLWLRHVLDAVYHAQDYPIAFLSYEQLMQDWQGFVQSMQAQIDLAFPRQSILSSLEIEGYLEDEQKHNSVSLEDLKQSTEFSPFIIQAYEWLLALVAGQDRVVALQGLLALREQFNRDSALYAKVLLAEELLNAKQRTKVEKDHQEYIAHLGRVQDSLKLTYEGKLHTQERALSARDEYYKQQLTELNALKQQIQAQKDQFAEALHDCKVTNKTLSAELRHLELESRKLRARLVNLLEKPQRALANMEAEPALSFDLNDPVVQNHLTLIESSELFDKVYYTTHYPEASESKFSALEHYYFIGAKKGYDPNPLFASTWYIQKNKDLQDSKENPLIHYLTLGRSLRLQTHPLFDAKWYLEYYADLGADQVDALWHYLKYGASELRNPNPLFLSSYYVYEYPEVLKNKLNPLYHYLKYGDEWGYKAHPLFDSRFYIKQIGQLPECVTALGHYLNHSHFWRMAPSECFDGAWYLDNNPDVAADHINPLVHYSLYGHQDGRLPHPHADEVSFIHKHQASFRKAGISLKTPLISTVEALTNTEEETASAQAKSLVNPALQRMLDFDECPLQAPSQSFTQDQLVIHWVTCDFARQGGGGNMTIFRFVRLFELFGHKQHIWLHNQVIHHSNTEAREDLIRHYQQTTAELHFVDDTFKQASGDIIIATDWESVWPVLSASLFKRRFYFVQDFEPAFFATGSTSLAAELTYYEDLDCICAGPWLKKLMQERYGRWATHFCLSADQDVYFPMPAKVVNELPRIAFYARTSTSRRAVELGLLALNYLADKGYKFHVDLFGSADNQTWLNQVRFNYTDHGVLSAVALGHLYRACDIGMVFSATNYSLVPQEMMACDLAVLELDGDNTRTIFPQDTIVLAQPHPRAIAEQLQTLLNDVALRLKIAAAGGQWARQFHWETTAQHVSQAIQQHLQSLGYEALPKPEQVSLKASVVIPTLNGGKLLLQVVDAVLKQKAPWSFDLLIIDSGSTDGSIEQLQAKGVRIHSIPKSEFSHGGTRNLGVTLSSGEYVAFLTQDALPADDNWLFSLVSTLDYEPEAAGAFGQHLPYPEASAFVKRDLSNHFKHLSQYPLYLDKNTDLKRFNTGESAWRQVLHFYSDNNSCLRRSVWQQIPYPVIEYGEDQVWADLIIKAGYKKAYAINALVFHSHDYNEQETFERSRIEANFFYQYFGYILLSGQGAYVRTLEELNTQDRLYAQLNALSEESLNKQLLLNEARLKGYLAINLSPP